MFFYYALVLFFILKDRKKFCRNSQYLFSHRCFVNMGKYIAVRYNPNLIFHLLPGLLTFILPFFHCLVLIDINPFKSNSLCFLFTLICVHCCSTHVLWCSLVLTSIHPHSACVHLFQFCYLCSLMFYLCSTGVHLCFACVYKFH